MEPSIINTAAKKLVGMHLQMSIVENKTGQLWGSFMARRSEITNSISKDLISMQIYEPSYFMNFNPSNTFEKWAAAAVTDFENIPAGMDTITLPGGMYGVFHYIGSSADSSIFHHIYSEWLPNSSYQLDDRPHFEVLGEKYKNNDPTSEEDIWIPLKEL